MSSEEIEQMDPAILELRDAGGIEHVVPAIEQCGSGDICANDLGADKLARGFQIVADAGGPPHIIHGVLIAGIVARQAI